MLYHEVSFPYFSIIHIYLYYRKELLLCLFNIEKGNQEFFSFTEEKTSRRRKAVDKIIKKPKKTKGRKAFCEVHKNMKKMKKKVTDWKEESDGNVKRCQKGVRGK